MKYFFTASLLSVIVVAGLAISWVYQNKQFCARAEDKRKKNEEEIENSSHDVVADDTEEAEEEEALLEILVQEEAASLKKRSEESYLLGKSTIISNSSPSVGSNTGSGHPNSGIYANNHGASELVNRRQHVRAIRARFEAMQAKTAPVVVDATPYPGSSAQTTPMGSISNESMAPDKKTPVTSKKPTDLKSFLRTCSSNLERMNGITDETIDFSCASNQGDDVLTGCSTSSSSCLKAASESQPKQQPEAPEDPIAIDSPRGSSFDSSSSFVSTSSSSSSLTDGTKADLSLKKLQQFQMRVPSNMARYGSS